MVTGAGPPPKPDPAEPPLDRAPPEPAAVGDKATICPECGGVLTERSEAGTTVWQCRVGHRYSPESLLDAQAMDVEAAMWAAVRALEYRGRLLERLADQFEARGQLRSARSFREQATAARDQARIVRETLVQAANFSLAHGEDTGDPDEMSARRAAEGGGR